MQLYESTNPQQPFIYHGNSCAHEVNVVSTASVLPRTPGDINSIFTVVSIVSRNFNPGKRCVQEGKHRNVMLEHGTGTGTRIRTGTGTGTKLETVILRTVLVIPEFKCRTKFRESWESV